MWPHLTVVINVVIAEGAGLERSLATGKGDRRPGAVKIIGSASGRMWPIGLQVGDAG